LLEWAALHGRRQSGSLWRVAVKTVVEAVRDPDLGRRRADCARWRARNVRAAVEIAPSSRGKCGMAQGALRMSRSVRFAPIILLLLILIAMVWRLSTPTNTNVPSKLEGRPLPA